jgi:hypothetical protein
LLKRQANPVDIAGMMDDIRSGASNLGNGMAKKKNDDLDPETLALIQWCTEVEPFLVAGGATLAQAQDHIEEEIEWFTDQFYDGLTPEEAAQAALA